MNVLTEAEQIIYGDREQTYGDPGINLSRISALWETYLVEKYRKEINISSEDVSWMMVLLKIAREMNKSKRDNLVDACGYIALIERVKNARNG